MGLQNIREHAEYLQALKKAKTKKKRQLLLEAGGYPLVKCIGECCHNILHSGVPLSEPVRQHLKKHAKHIREVGDRKVGVKRKKEILLQHGGFLPTLLVPIISAVTGLVGGLLNR